MHITGFLSPTSSNYLNAAFSFAVLDLRWELYEKKEGQPNEDSTCILDKHGSVLGFSPSRGAPRLLV